MNQNGPTSSWFDQEILRKMPAIDALLVVCLNMAGIVSDVRHLPPNFKGLPKDLIKATLRRLVVVINETTEEYLKRCDPWIPRLQSVHGKEIVRLGGYTGTCYAELTFSVMKEAYMWLWPRLQPVSNDKFIAYLSGGSQGAPPPLIANDVWVEWSQDPRLSEVLLPEKLRVSSLPDYDELCNYLRQEFAVVREELKSPVNSGEDADADLQCEPGQAASGDQTRDLNPTRVGGRLDSADVQDRNTELNRRPFTGGEVVFHGDRIELCGVDICSGRRSGSRRVVLELLARKRADGSFVPYSGEDLEAKAKELGATGSANGWIRDLRDDITERLLNHVGMVCGREGVILSGDTGYRFFENLTVRYVGTAPISDITDTADDVNVRNGDVRDVFEVPDDEAAKRRQWILHQLQDGVQLKAPMVAIQFRRSKKTAQRDLDALRDEGKVEFVGDPRTGYYRFRERP